MNRLSGHRNHMAGVVQRNLVRLLKVFAQTLLRFCPPGYNNQWYHQMRVGKFRSNWTELLQRNQTFDFLIEFVLLNCTALCRAGDKFDNSRKAIDIQYTDDFPCPICLFTALNYLFSSYGKLYHRSLRKSNINKLNRKTWVYSLFTYTQDGMNTCPLSSVLLDAYVKAVQVSR
jgi:hypothetical protein